MQDTCIIKAAITHLNILLRRTYWSHRVPTQDIKPNTNVQEAQIGCAHHGFARQNTRQRGAVSQIVSYLSMRAVPLHSFDSAMSITSIKKSATQSYSYVSEAKITYMCYECEH